MCFFEFFPIFPWLWKKTKKNDGKIEKTGFFPSLQNTKKIDDLFSSVLSQLKKYHPSGNLKFNYLGIFQSLKLCISLAKSHFNFS